MHCWSKYRTNRLIKLFFGSSFVLYFCIFWVKLENLPGLDPLKMPRKFFCFLSLQKKFL